MNFEESKQAVALAIDENFVCHAEDHCRNLEWQLDQVQNQQRQLRDYVNDSLTPTIGEIRDMLRELRKDNEGS